MTGVLAERPSSPDRQHLGKTARPPHRREHRSPSLRTRVALVSGAVAALVALTLGITYTALLGAAGSRQLDDTLSSLGIIVAGPRQGVPAQPLSPDVAGPLAKTGTPFATAQPNPGSPHVGNAPTQPDQTPSQPGNAPAPPNPATPQPNPGSPNAGSPPSPSQTKPAEPQVNQAPEPRDERQVTVPRDETLAKVDGLPGVTVALNPDRDRVDAAVRDSQLIGVAIGVAGVALAALLGWLLAGYAAQPLRRLATATHGIDTLDELPPLSGRGAREAEELSDAITRMLARLESAHTATTRALAGARDFAAVCAHELRTPLTALRTDLQVLATKDIPAEQRHTIMSDVLLAEQQIETTLTDLERLAVGELTESDAFEPFELCETLDRAVQDAQRRHPDTHIELTTCTPVTVTGLPGGIMLIVNNAVANAVQHGKARNISVTADSTGDTVELLIDDDGTGIPEPLRHKAFDRFVKSPSSPGSGLGLALIRQQAELHSGTAELTESPSGGTRLRVRLTAEPPG
ncbi:MULTISPECIES: HAMP domain-containing sensor histidine kinase [unclassified Nocardia]|uniref:sensor histidine kinase n=1 Tax=unclassified Nocardia TaxID=2637762 RepID=UPI001CE4261F|nr:MULTISPECIES: HAMP domain-containing sensor histidine kinase [unclassified Nocardia]